MKARLHLRWALDRTASWQMSRRETDTEILTRHTACAELEEIR